MANIRTWDEMRSDRDQARREEEGPSHVEIIRQVRAALRRLKWATTQEVATEAQVQLTQTHSALEAMHTLSQIGRKGDHWQPDWTPAA